MKKKKENKFSTDVPYKKLNDGYRAIKIFLIRKFSLTYIIKLQKGIDMFQT